VTGIGALAAIGALGGEIAAEAVAVGLAALWGVGGVRAAAAASRRARRGDGSDQATLAEVLVLPTAFWSATMVVMALVLGFGAALLIGPAITSAG
jgi:hypothetical protein